MTDWGSGQGGELVLHKGDLIVVLGMHLSSVAVIMNVFWAVFFYSHKPEEDTNSPMWKGKVGDKGNAMFVCYCYFICDKTNLLSHLLLLLFLSSCCIVVVVSLVAAADVYQWDFSLCLSVNTTVENR
jgi:hypothetical protein